MKEEFKKVRWRYYIDKKFQNQFMLRFSLIIILVVVATLALLWLVRENPYGTYGLMPGNVVWTLTDKPVMCGTGDNQFPLLKPDKPHNAFDLFWKPIIIVGGMNLLLIIIFSLFYSHSMAGPIHNMKRSLRELIAGSEPKPIRIRKGDQFQDMVDLLNQVIEKRVK